MRGIVLTAIGCMLIGCGKPAAPAVTSTAEATVEATAPASTSGGKVDPEFAAAAKKLLDDAEILATLSKVDASDDAKFKERQDAVAEDLIRLPKSDAQPMKNLRRSCEALASTCAGFGVTRRLVQSNSDNQKLYSDDVALITSDVNRLRDAIKNNEAFLFPGLEN